MKNSVYLLALIGLLAVWSCKSKQPERPIESYLHFTDMPLPSSEIEIPIRLARQEVEQLVNEQLTDVLFDNSESQAGLKVKASRALPIQLQVFSNAIRYIVPLELNVTQNVLLGNLNADGQITLNFKTDFMIDPNWVVTTKTSVEGYEWNRKPALNLGFTSLPIEFIGNTVMRNAREQIAASIDQELGKSIQLRSELQKAWNQLFQPVTLSDVYKTHLLINPEDISMTPFRSAGDTIAAEIHVRCLPRVTIGDRPATPQPTLLPTYSLADQDQRGFSVNLKTVVPFAEAEAIARTSLQGYEYEIGGKKVVVEDIELFGQNGALVMGTKLSGRYNGTIYLKGQPMYDPRSKRVEIQNLEFDFSTKKTLLKTATWLFKGKLERQLQENIDFYTEYNIGYLRKQLEEGLSNNQLMPGVLLDGVVDDMDIRAIDLTEEGFLMTIFLTGEVEVNLQTIQLLGKQ